MDQLCSSSDFWDVCNGFSLPGVGYADTGAFYELEIAARVTDNTGFCVQR